MRKDSAFIVGATALITAAILGGAWYMAQRQAAVAVDPKETIWTTLDPGVGGASSVPDISAETSTGRSARIIACGLPDGSKAFTNAASCAEADFDNRLSIADPLAAPSVQSRYSGEDYQPPAQQARDARADAKPNLRLTGKSPPSGLNPSCTFNVGKALELERALSAAEEPGESIWREDYCRWIQEARAENCQVPSDLFYYGNLCGLPR
jgi:hypothetical protein